MQKFNVEKNPYKTDKVIRYSGLKSQELQQVNKRLRQMYFGSPLRSLAQDGKKLLKLNGPIDSQIFYHVSVDQAFNLFGKYGNYETAAALANISENIVPYMTDLQYDVTIKIGNLLYPDDATTSLHYYKRASSANPKSTRAYRKIAKTLDYGLEHDEVAKMAILNLIKSIELCDRYLLRVENDITMKINRSQALDKKDFFDLKATIENNVKGIQIQRVKAMSRLMDIIKNATDYHGPTISGLIPKDVADHKKLVDNIYTKANKLVQASKLDIDFRKNGELSLILSNNEIVTNGSLKSPSVSNSYLRADAYEECLTIK